MREQQRTLADSRFFVSALTTRYAFIFNVARITTVHNERIITPSMIKIIIATAAMSRAHVSQILGGKSKYSSSSLLPHSSSHQLVGFNELDALNPLDHLVSELVLDGPPEGRSIHGGRWLAVHFKREHTFRLQRRCRDPGCRSTSRVERIAKGIESDRICIRQGFNVLDDLSQRNAMPLRHHIPQALLNGNGGNGRLYPPLRRPTVSW